MLIKQVLSACSRFPANNKERYLIYPALAVYSPIKNGVKTAVGSAFTLLSILTLGTCPPINNVADWTRHSRGIVTIPMQIFGNIFGIHSEILSQYNVFSPEERFLLNAVRQAGVERPGINIEGMIPHLQNILENQDCDALSDIAFYKARKILTSLFQNSTNNKIELLAKHFLFRSYSIFNALGSVGCFTATILISPCCALSALYHKGTNQSENKLALLALKLPYLIHYLGLTLRMAVNPHQFLNEPPPERPDLDPHPYLNALKAPGDFWQNALEI